ncbi:MAG: zinc ribbon domain-containing protein [Lachnospiraceae bacterium]|nr:zinc ribbon domain-containing protein [Lachnospiraceae bacterium]
MATSTEILKQISTSVTEAGKDGLEKAKELRDSARLTLEIRSRENSIQKAYRELGKAYFQAHRNDEDPEYDQIAFIKAAFEEIGELKTAKDEIRGVKRCSNCGNPIADGVNYCPNCGTKYEEPEEVAEEAAEEAAEEMEEAAEEAAEEAEEEEEK